MRKKQVIGNRCIMKYYNLKALSDKELEIAKSILFTIMNIIPCTDTNVYLSRPPACSTCEHKNFCDTLSAIYSSMSIEKLRREFERNNDLC